MTFTASRRVRAILPAPNKWHLPLLFAPPSYTRFRSNVTSASLPSQMAAESQVSVELSRAKLGPAVSQPVWRSGGASAVRLNVCVVTAEHTTVNQDWLCEAPQGRLGRRFTPFKSASCQNLVSRELVCGFGVRRLSSGFSLGKKKKKTRDKKCPLMLTGKHVAASDCYDKQKKHDRQLLCLGVLAIFFVSWTFSEDELWWTAKCFMWSGHIGWQTCGRLFPPT